MTRLRAILLPEIPSHRASLGLLVLRLVAGGAMMSHGWGKIQNPFHWMDKAASPAPAVFQLLAAIAEFFGGLGIIVGALTVVASFGVLSTMVVAINTHVGKGDPFGKWELASLFLCIAVMLICVGPGAFSIDALVQRRAAGAGGPAVKAG
jgi:putative oxidoreductase